MKATKSSGERITFPGEDDLFLDAEGKSYWASEILYSDVDTVGCQFAGYVTIESHESSLCTDDWKRVERFERKNNEQSSN